MWKLIHRAMDPGVGLLSPVVRGQTWEAPRGACHVFKQEDSFLITLGQFPNDKLPSLAVAPSRHRCGLAHLLESDLAQGGWFMPHRGRGAQTRTQTRRTMKKGRSSLRNSDQTRSCSTHPHMTEQSFPFIAAIWERTREPGWHRLKIETEAKVWLNIWLSPLLRAHEGTCVCLPWLWRNNWDWWLSRHTSSHPTSALVVQCCSWHDFKVSLWN